jgi:hypothetical protein
MEELIQERSSVYGEKCTKFFFNHQHGNTTPKNVLKLVTNDGVTHDSPNNIMKEEVKYINNIPPSPLTKTNCN